MHALIAVKCKIIAHLNKLRLSIQIYDDDSFINLVIESVPFRDHSEISTGDALSFV